MHLSFLTAYLRKVGFMKLGENSKIEIIPVNTRKYIQQEGYMPLYYKPGLDIKIDKEYTHPSAWAHTIPHEKRACVRPVECFPYWLGITQMQAIGHEIGHNVRHLSGVPDGDEDHHTRHAYHHLSNSPFDYRVH